MVQAMTTASTITSPASQRSTSGPGCTESRHLRNRPTFDFQDGILTIKTDRYHLAWQNGVMIHLTTRVPAIRELTVVDGAMALSDLPNGLGSFHGNAKAACVQHRVVWHHFTVINMWECWRMPIFATIPVICRYSEFGRPTRCRVSLLFQCRRPPGDEGNTSQDQHLSGYPTTALGR